MKKKIIIIILTVAVFFASCGVGVATVFRVEGVRLDTSRISEESDAEAKELRLKLEEIYLNESIFTVKRSQAEEVMTQFPYFRISSFKRSYPDVLVIEVVEDEEVFAVETAQGSGEYYILGLDGTVLGVRNSVANRFDDERNVILMGKDLTVVGEKGFIISGDDCLESMLNLCKVLSQKLNGLRGNLLSVEILFRPTEGPVFRLEMQEGVEMIFYSPDVMTEEKAEKGIEKYFALSDAEKMSGTVLVLDDNQGNVIVSYSAETIKVE